MTGITTLRGNTSAAGRGAPATGSPPTDPKALARTGDVDAIALHLQAHSADRKPVEHEMVAGGRSGDLSRVARTLKYELPHWTTSKYGDGPTFSSPAGKTDTVASSSAWAGLVQSGKVTASEQRVIGRMAENEGKLDSVQAYDSETVSVGAMQKTVKAGGTGELAKQLYDFSQANPAKYKTLFADKGWTVAHTGKRTALDDYTMTYSTDGAPTTLAETRINIKDRAAPGHWKNALIPLLEAGRDPNFRAQQITDFKVRLDTAMAKVPAGTAYKAVKAVRPTPARSPPTSPPNRARRWCSTRASTGRTSSRGASVARSTLPRRQSESSRRSDAVDGAPARGLRAQDCGRISDPADGLRNDRCGDPL